MNTKILQYAILGTAHVLSNLSEKDIPNLRAVYLFGSVARMTATNESDIDVFFDTNISTTNQKKLGQRISKQFESFRTSIQGLLFRRERIENSFSPIVGKLDEWNDLKRTISVTGLQLYGPATLSLTGEPWLVYTWEKAHNRGAFLNAVYGYSIHDKKYSGCLQKSSGLKVGKSTIAIPTKNRKEFERLLKKYMVQYRVYEFLK